LVIMAFFCTTFYHKINQFFILEPRNRVVIGYELPPEFFQEVLRHYNSESLEPLLIYAEQESMADDDFGQVHNINFDDLHQVQDHYDEG